MLMEKCTTNHGCLIIDARNQSGRIEECVFHYRAKQRPPFRVGSRAFWRFGQKNLQLQNDGAVTDAEREAHERLLKRPRLRSNNNDDGDEDEINIEPSKKRQRGDAPDGEEYFDVLQHAAGTQQLNIHLE